MADNFIEEFYLEMDRQRDDAFKAGVARINDDTQLMGPDYISFYRIAADELFEKMKTKPGMLDLVAIPYLQSVRHTVELLMKSLLESVIHIARYRAELKLPEPTFDPSWKMLKAVENEHDLKDLLKLLREALKGAGLDPPAPSMVALIEKISSHERHPTALRYPRGHEKNGKVPSSFEKGTKIEIFAMHDAFDAFMDEHLAHFGEPEGASVQGRLEQELHSLLLEEMHRGEAEAARDAKNTAIRNTLLRLGGWLQEQRRKQGAEAAAFSLCADELKRIFVEEMKNAGVGETP